MIGILFITFPILEQNFCYFFNLFYRFILRAISEWRLNLETFKFVGSIDSTLCVQTDLSFKIQ
jgi:hypothetical protein